MKVIDEFHGERCLCSSTDAAGIRQSGVNESLCLQYVSGEAKQLILGSDQGFHVLLRRSCCPGLKSLVRVNRSEYRGKDILVRSFPIVTVTASDGCP